MKFYKITARNRYEEENSSFNSQRDEILLLFVLPIVTENAGFNSQRDEILQWLHLKDLILRFQVSIPNGMEFYARSRQTNS